MFRLPIPSRLMIAGRLGLGVACLLAPGLVVQLLGFPDRSSSARTLARMVGGRDLAMALVLLATGSDPATHKRAVQIAGLIDVGDVAAIVVGAAGDPRLRSAAYRNLPFAGGSAVFSFLASRAV